MHFLLSEINFSIFENGSRDFVVFRLVLLPIDAGMLIIRVVG